MGMTIEVGGLPLDHPYPIFLIDDHEYILAMCTEIEGALGAKYGVLHVESMAPVLNDCNLLRELRARDTELLEVRTRGYFSSFVVYQDGTDAEVNMESLELTGEINYD